MRKSNSDNRFMIVRKVPEYLQINDKGINALATKEKNTRDKKFNNGCYHVNWSIARCSNPLMEETLLPDWLFAGSEDPLLYQTLLTLPNSMPSHGLVIYTENGNRLGLEFFSSQKVNDSCLNWGELY